MRSSTHIAGSCVVCGSNDSRALSTTRLSRGDVVVVCGSHESMHSKMTSKAATVTELRQKIGERRTIVERRQTSGDELADALADAFAPKTRRGLDRRA